VESNMAVPLNFRSLPKDEIHRRVSRELTRFGIAQLAKRQARTLSGGEAQRVSLARAFAIEPEILFLDEPFAALDLPTRQTLTSDFSAVLRDSGITACFTTHDRDEALRLSTRLAVMEKGRILQEGPSEEVSSRPAHEFVAQFMGIETLVNVRIEQAKETVSGVFYANTPRGIRLEIAGNPPKGNHALIGIRPENVVLEIAPKSENADAKHQHSSRNRFQAVIQRIIPGLPWCRAEMDAGFPLVAAITRHAIADLNLREGLTVHASFKATAVHVIR
jgi:tungstate transport system ATP-binding protein